MKNTPSIWLTNLEHGRRHEALPLMSMKDNLKFSKHKEIVGRKSYAKYDNYDAIFFHSVIFLSILLLIFLPLMEMCYQRIFFDEQIV